MRSGYEPDFKAAGRKIDAARQQWMIDRRVTLRAAGRVARRTAQRRASRAVGAGNAEPEN